MTFNLDSNGILSVNAKEESTGKSKNIKIRNEKGRLHKSEIDRMIADAEKYREEDEVAKQRVSSRNALESYLFSIRTAIKEHGKSFDDQDRIPVEKLVNEHIAWLEINREKDAEVYEDKYKYMQRVIMPVMEKIHKKGAESGLKIEEVN